MKLLGGYSIALELKNSKDRWAQSDSINPEFTKELHCDLQTQKSPWSIWLPDQHCLQKEKIFFYLPYKLSQQR